jgi:serine/threonine protein kinase/tetratricopeptide (TPR) repeat protein
MIGKTISHYKILEKLGEGGMGVVYKAEDTKLKRTVALKFLTPQTLESEEEKAHFVQEAQAAAALEHPNICTIHEIDEANGQTFIAMACIDGQTLNERVQAGALKLNDTLDLVIQVAEGLQEAHQKGIVHRDIKPGNIMLTSKGQAKIMDFGLAKLAKAKQAAKTDTTTGTAAYMSPEQAKGEAVDHRTDIWSLGVVLYELLTGKLPFGGEYDKAILYSIMNEEPVPVTHINASIPAELEQIVNKALRKRVEDRYSSVQEMLHDLKQTRKRLDFGLSEPKKISWKKFRQELLRKTIIIPTVILFVALVAITSVLLLSSRNELAPVSVAVLDFENHTQDSSFAGILSDLLITDLAQSSYVKVLSKERMRDLQHQLGIKTINDSTGFMLSHRAQIQALVLPKIVQIGETFRISASLYDVTTKDLLFAEHVQGKGQDAIFEMIDELSKEIRTGLKVMPREDTDHYRGLSEVTTSSMEAYKLYSLGRSMHSGDDPLKSIPLVEQAVALDSTFVDAFRALAVLYSNIGDSRNALLNAQRAKELSRKRDATEFLKSVIVEYRVQRNWDQAIEYMKRYLELKPDDVQMHLQLGYDLSRHKKAFVEAIPQFRQVIALDPKNLSGQLGPAYNYLGHAYLYLSQFEKAMDALKQYKSLAPNKPDPLHSMADALSFKGEYRQAIAQYSEIIQKYPGFYESYEDIGLAYLAIGKWRDALSAFERYLSTAPQGLWPKGHFLLGRVYFIQDDTALAQREIEEVLALNPLSLQAHWLRGLIALTSGDDLDSARKEMQIMEELMEHPNTLDEIAYYHHLRGRILLAENKIDEGLEALQNAVEASPRNFIYFRKEVTHGYLIAGLIKEAIKEASEILTFNENDGEVLYLLGLAYLQNGALDEAASCFQRAQRTWREADSDFRPSEQLESKLEEMT